MAGWYIGAFHVLIMVVKSSHLGPRYDRLMLGTYHSVVSASPPILVSTYHVYDGVGATVMEPCKTMVCGMPPSTNFITGSRYLADPAKPQLLMYMGTLIQGP